MPKGIGYKGGHKPKQALADMRGRRKPTDNFEERSGVLSAMKNRLKRKQFTT